MELDYDLIILTIEEFLKIDLTQQSMLEIAALTYNILFLGTSKELSVRDYSVYALKKIYSTLGAMDSQSGE